MQKQTRSMQHTRLKTGIALGALLLALSAAPAAKAACLALTVNLVATQQASFDTYTGGIYQSRTIQVRITTWDILNRIAAAQATPTTFPDGSQLCFEGSSSPLTVRDENDALLLSIDPAILALEIDTSPAYSKTVNLTKGTAIYNYWTTGTFDMDLTAPELSSPLKFDTNALVNIKTNWKSPATEVQTLINIKAMGTGNLYWAFIAIPDNANLLVSPLPIISGKLTLKGTTPASS